MEYALKCKIFQVQSYPSLGGKGLVSSPRETNATVSSGISGARKLPTMKLAGSDPWHRPPELLILHAYPFRIHSTFGTTEYVQFQSENGTSCGGGGSYISSQEPTRNFYLSRMKSFRPESAAGDNDGGVSVPECVAARNHGGEMEGGGGGIGTLGTHCRSPKPLSPSTNWFELSLIETCGNRVVDYNRFCS